MGACLMSCALTRNVNICNALAGTEKHIARKIEDPIVELKDLPRCTKCNALARPGVVWFDEMPHRLDEIDELVEGADLCLVIGTSAVVSQCFTLLDYRLMSFGVVRYILLPAIPPE
jgi:NAD-dependent SIR2 family protein deacetylase